MPTSPARTNLVRVECYLHPDADSTLLAHLTAQPRSRRSAEMRRLMMLGLGTPQLAPMPHFAPPAPAALPSVEPENDNRTPDARAKARRMFG